MTQDRFSDPAILLIGNDVVDSLDYSSINNVLSLRKLPQTLFLNPYSYLFWHLIAIVKYQL